MDLPIRDIEPYIIQRLQTGNRLVLVAPTGSGKTTQVPQMIWDSIDLQGQKIIVLQPRRVAARSVAARVAWERNVPLGQAVGYRIRFEDQTSPATRLEFVTEGILLRWLRDNPTLQGIGAILFDEFHERNLLSDVALAIVKQLQETQRPDLKVVVMSATLDAEPVAHFLNDCPLLRSEGQSYPVQVHYLEHQDRRPITEQAADQVERILRSDLPGDILIFMPGMGEIMSTLQNIRAAHISEPITLIPLHGDLPPDEQDRAFAPSKSRKIVVATNVAETSITIDGIQHVIDSGLARIARFEPERGLHTLFLESISRASADQRKGRAGRTSSGHCWRLWSESSQLNRPETNTPEIQRADLAEVVLLLHSLGIRNANHFQWLDQPDPSAVSQAEALLISLGALDPAPPSTPSEDAPHPTGDLTPIGWQMLQLPLHPRYSRMLIEALHRQCVPAIALCAALTSGRDLLIRTSRGDKRIEEAREVFQSDTRSDFFTAIRAFEFAKKSNFNTEACRQYGIHSQTARTVDQTYQQILSITSQLKPAHPSPETPPTPNADESILQCLMTGFIDQLCLRRDKGTLECDLPGNRRGTLARESVVQESPLFVVANIRQISSSVRSSDLTLLSMASEVQERWLREIFPNQLVESIQALYDSLHKRVATIKLIRFNTLAIRAESYPESDPLECGRCLAQAYQDDKFELPLFNHEVKQWISRVQTLRNHAPELELPSFDDKDLHCVLSQAFHGQTLTKEAQKIPLLPFFKKHLTPDQSEWLAELCPTSLKLSEGTTSKILYPYPLNDKKGNPQPPEITLKLQDAFEWTSHPTLIDGKLPVLVYLCTPDGKRWQTTTDWTTFRTREYPKHKLALQRKYPAILWH